jgi:hypothetical protein
VEVVPLAVSVDHLLGAAAVIASLAGLAMTVFGYVSGRKDATHKAEMLCHEKLLAEQRVSEGLSTELHELRMKFRVIP